MVVLQFDTRMQVTTYDQGQGHIGECQGHKGQCKNVGRIHFVGWGMRLVDRKSHGIIIKVLIHSDSIKFERISRSKVVRCRCKVQM